MFPKLISLLGMAAFVAFAWLLSNMGMLIAFVAVVALANAVCGAAQGAFGVAPENQFTLQTLLGHVNAPFAWLMGVPWKDCTVVGQALGERIVLNEFIVSVT